MRTEGGGKGEREVSSFVTRPRERGERKKGYSHLILLYPLREVGRKTKEEEKRGQPFSVSGGGGGRKKKGCGR